MRIRFVLALIFLLVVVPAAAQPAIDLGGQYTYAGDDGQISLRYPASWVLEVYLEDDFLYLLLSSDLDAVGRDLNLDGLKPGQVQLDLVIDLLVAFDTKGLDSGVGDLKQVDLYEAMAEFLAREGRGAFIEGEITTMLIDGQPVARATLNRGELGRVEYIFSLREQDERAFLVHLTLRTASNELDQWRPTALAVLESVIVSTFDDSEPAESTAVPAPIIPLTQTASFGGNTVRYPAEWVSGLDIYEDVLTLGTSIAAAYRLFGYPFQSGEAQMYVLVASLDHFAELSRRPLSENDSPLDVLQALLHAASVPSLRGGSPFSASDVVAIEFNGAEAARARVFGQGFEGMTWLVQYEPGIFVLGRLLTAPSELAQWQATAEAMLASVTYSSD